MPGRTPRRSASAVTGPSSGSVPATGASAAGRRARPGCFRKAARSAKPGTRMQAIMGTYVLHEHTFPAKRGPELPSGARPRVPPPSAENDAPMRTRAFLALPVMLLAVAVTPLAAAAWDPGVAALQVGLHTRGLYAGPIDGITGPATQKAIRKLQAHARIAVDGVVGPKTRRALGHFARHRLGQRPLHIGNAGWDVASLQFQLAEHGFPSGSFDGIFGPHIDAAVRRFQEYAGLKTDGVAGPATLKALGKPPA